MRKVLFTAHKDSHILNFHLPYLKYFKESGFEVHVASNGVSHVPYADMKYNVPFHRLPVNPQNLKAYKKMRKIINGNDYSLIHCNTPMGGALTRLAARYTRKKGTSIIYTAHGFHFYKGAPLSHWAIYFPVEKWLSKFTDCLITINDEDYNNTIKHHFKSADIRLINGVGVDLNVFSPGVIKSKSQLRKQYGFGQTDFILIFAAELNFNKHQDLLINMVNTIKDQIPCMKLLLAGDGPLSKQYKNQVSTLGLKSNVHFLGQRNDIPELLKLSDIAVSSSRREGLPVNVLEAMATGLPLVVTNCRGNNDLVNDGENGFIVGIEDIDGFVRAVESLYQSEELRRDFGLKNLEMIKSYSLDSIAKEMGNIYKSCLLINDNKKNIS